MPNTGQKLPGTGSTEDRNGFPWENPTNIQTEANYAQCNITLQTYGDWLRASNFGFSIPTNVEVNGVRVYINRKGSLVGTIEDSSVRLVNADGNNEGNDKASGFWPVDADTATYGGTFDTWGISLTPEIINSTNFGIRLSALNYDPIASAATVYWVKITIFYTLITDYKTAGACASVTRSGSGVGWTNPSYAQTSNNSYTNASVPQSAYTDWLRVTQFGFTDEDFSLDSIILAVDVKIERKAGITDNLCDSALYLRTATGQEGYDKALATKWETSDTEVTYHWGDGEFGILFPLYIKDSEFGVELSVLNDADATTSAYVDCISIRFYYWPGEISVLPVTLQEYYITGDNTRTDVRGSLWKAQTFTPATSHKITSITGRLYRTGNPGTLTVSIRVTDVNGHPTGADLCSGTTDGNTLPTGSPYEWREITLGTGYQISASIKYAIVLRALSGTLSNTVSWRLDSTGDYTGGNSETSTNSGGLWASSLNYDFMFEEWGQVGIAGGKILLEDGGGLLIEDGYYLLQESTGGAAYLRLILSNLTLSATITRSRNKKKIITSALTISATIGRIFGRKRTVASALTLAATISRGFKKVINSNLTLAATVAKKVEFHRTIASAISLAATIATGAKHAYLEVINSVLTLAATIGHKVGYHKAVGSALTLSATVGRKAGFKRAIASSLTLAATIALTKGFKRTIDSSLTLAASVARKVASKRAISSNLSLATTIVVTAIDKLLKVIVTEGNIFVVKVVEGNLYSIKTAMGNVFSVKTVEGAIYAIKTAAGKLFGIKDKE